MLSEKLFVFNIYRFIYDVQRSNGFPYILKPAILNPQGPGGF